MSFFIERFLGPWSQGLRAVVRHDAQIFVAELVGPVERLQTIEGTLVNCELDVLKVESWNVVDKSVAHGLFAVGADAVKFVGSVANVIEIDEGRCVMDVYSRTGPEFLALDSSEVRNARWQKGTSVELLIRGLHLFPTWT